MRSLPAPRHASIIKERNEVRKERNKVSTASAYYLEQRRARLIVDGIKNRQDCKRKQRQSDRKRKQRQRTRVKES